MSAFLGAGLVGNADAITKLINEAYELEMGDTGVAFKSTPRLLDNNDSGMGAAYVEDRVVVVTVDGAIVGVIVWEIHSKEVMYFGPLAVRASSQGLGLGKQLIAHVAGLGRAKGCGVVEISVVSTRTDLLPLYAKLGFERVREMAFPDPERATRECHMVVLQAPVETLIAIAPIAPTTD